MYESSDIVALLLIKLECGGYSEHNNNLLLFRLIAVAITSIALALELASVVISGMHRLRHRCLFQAGNSVVQLSFTLAKP